MFTNEEYADMHLVYGEVHQNSRAAVQRYRELFPHRRTPNRRVFQDLHRRLVEFGHVQQNVWDLGRNVDANAVDRDELILELVDGNPNLSIRQISDMVRTSTFTVWQVLQREALHPYHYTRVQALQPQDYERRVNFCRWMLETIAENPRILDRLLFTDECNFGRNGTVNLRNLHYWSIQNPRLARPVYYQRRFSVNIWVGIMGERLVGPFILPDRLNGNLYLQFLRNEIEDFRDNLPLNLYQNMWFMHDGAPPHFERHVVNYLNVEYNNQWIGRNGPVAWPARSPDLNPLDFYFWGHMRTLIYGTIPENRDDLVNRIMNSANQIRNDPHILQSVQQNVIRRLNLCIEQN